jgi:hypothetical protein
MLCVLACFLKKRWLLPAMLGGRACSAFFTCVFSSECIVRVGLLQLLQV